MAGQRARYIAPAMRPPAELVDPGSNKSIEFVLRLGRALHVHGFPAHRLEQILGRVATRLGLEGQFVSTPTSISAAFGPEDAQHTFLLRVEPGEVHLEKLALLDQVVGEILSGTLTPAEGSARIARIVDAPSRWPAWLVTLAFGIGAGAAGRFLGGGLREIGVAAAIGLVLGALLGIAGRSERLRRVFVPLAALTGAALAGAFSHAIGPYSVFTATLAGILVLIPGLTLTTAMTELSTNHLVSGTARLTGAAVTFLSLAVGVALGGKLVGLALGASLVAAPIGLPAWTEWLALFVAPLCFAVLLRAPARDAGWILAVGVLAFMGGRVGAMWLGPELGIFAGALIAGVASNLYGRYLDRPSVITIVPAILLLVPGSVGFRGLVALINRDVVIGVETAFRAALMLATLVAGLLIANVAVRPRKRG